MQKTAKPNEILLVKYSDSNTAGFDLGLLGDSFIGFNSIFKSLVAVSGLKGDIELKASRIETGSVDLYNLVILTLQTVPFENAQDLLDFLKVASHELHTEAVQFFSSLEHVDRNVNDYFKERPLDVGIVLLLGDYILGMISRARKIKSNTSLDAPELRDLSHKQVSFLRNMIRDAKFRRALKPITEGSVSSIGLSNVRRPNAKPIMVTEENVGDYLPDKAQILPELENGNVRRFSGEVVTLQSAHGDSLKIRVDGLPKSYSLLVALPDAGKSTKDFTEYYQQKVVFTSMVYRPNLFVRPKLIVKDMALAQEQLEVND